MFVLVNKQNPDDIQRTKNKGQRDWLLEHGYRLLEEWESDGTIPTHTAEGFPIVTSKPRGKKSGETEPPSNLGKLADELSARDGEGD